MEEMHDIISRHQQLHLELIKLIKPQVQVFLVNVDLRIHLFIY
jgi:hypothetical protein